MQLVITSYSIHYTKLYEENFPQIIHQFSARKHRITSYNVCYTKLLRTSQMKKSMSRCKSPFSVLPRAVSNQKSAQPVKPAQCFLPDRFRITSYNVCYTKLLRSIKACSFACKMVINSAQPGNSPIACCIFPVFV